MGTLCLCSDSQAERTPIHAESRSRLLCREDHLPQASAVPPRVRVVAKKFRPRFGKSVPPDHFGRSFWQPPDDYRDQSSPRKPWNEDTCANNSSIDPKEPQGIDPAEAG
jgi:hypothetical protein